MEFCAASIAIVGGCGNGTPDRATARASALLIAEGSKAIARVCKLDKHLAARVRFTHRRREVLAFRLRGTPASVSASPPGKVPSRVLLYNFGSRTVSERVRSERAYCSKR
jgi:hypothetical protein